MRPLARWAVRLGYSEEVNRDPHDDLRVLLTGAKLSEPPAVPPVEHLNFQGIVRLGSPIRLEGASLIPKVFAIPIADDERALEISVANFGVRIFLVAPPFRSN